MVSPAHRSNCHVELSSFLGDLINRLQILFVKSQKWHDTHFLTCRHNTKIVEFYPTMAAETDSYEDNANKLHP